MNTNDTSKNFPENEVDQLIADFGKKPDPEKREQIKEMLMEQKEPYKAVRNALDMANNREQGQEKDMDRGR